MAKLKETTPLQVEQEKRVRLEQMLTQERGAKVRAEEQRVVLEAALRVAVKEGKPISDLEQQLAAVEAALAAKGRTLGILEEELAVTVDRIAELELQEKREALPAFSREIITEVGALAGPLRDALLDVQARLPMLQERNRQLQEEWRRVFGEGNPLIREEVAHAGVERLTHIVQSAVGGLQDLLDRVLAPSR